MGFGGSPLGAHISGGLIRVRMQIHNALWDNGVYLIVIHTEWFTSYAVGSDLD